MVNGPKILDVAKEENTSTYVEQPTNSIIISLDKGRTEVVQKGDK